MSKPAWAKLGLPEEACAVLAAISDPEALAAAKSAVARLQARADRIGDPTLRASFLERVPEHAATLAL